LKLYDFDSSYSLSSSQKPIELSHEQLDANSSGWINEHLQLLPNSDKGITRS